jgi:choline monooxygenase
MDLSRFEIDADIRRARTLPARFYADRDVHAIVLQRVFARSWQFVGDAADLRRPGSAVPVTLLPGALDEPLLLTRDHHDRTRCLSNVCTHRGNLLVEGACVARDLRCHYHGRRFDLDGRFRSAPGFDDALEFPSPSDDLPSRPLEQFGPLLFTGPGGGDALLARLAPLIDRVGLLGLEDAAFEPARSRDYLVRANWALYCDNYLEGFHIPFVHAGLTATVDIDSYAIDPAPGGCLQVAEAASGQPTFALQVDHPDAGRRIAAYYWWSFPNTMINVYPWGISLNVVCPLGVDLSRVTFRSYVLDAALLDQGAGGALDRVEREDEAVVEACQKGVRSRLAGRGRYSPAHERGVHHFHRLLLAALREDVAG